MLPGCISVTNIDVQTYWSEKFVIDNLTEETEAGTAVIRWEGAELGPETTPTCQVLHFICPQAFFASSISLSCLTFALSSWWHSSATHTQYIHTHTCLRRENCVMDTSPSPTAVPLSLIGLVSLIWNSTMVLRHDDQYNLLRVCVCIQCRVL